MDAITSTLLTGSAHCGNDQLRLNNTQKQTTQGQDYIGTRECNPGTRVPENPGNPPVFKPVNPGLYAGKNPGLTGSISGVSQYSVHCSEKRAETEST